jgi:hypothetical protein
MRGSARQVVILLLLTAAALTLLHVGNLLSGGGVELVDFEEEANVPTWVGAMQFFAVALCAELLARGSHGRPRLAWRVVAAAFVFFSVDELATIHERALRVASDSDDAWWWPILFLPLFAAVLAALWSVAGEVRRDLGSRLPVLAGVALLGSALALDALGAALELYDEALVHVALHRIVEELLELLGGLVLIATFVALLEHRLRRRGQEAHAG